MRLSRSESEAVHDNDASAFADAIMRWRRGGGTGRPWILVETLYSMDGDQALDALAGIAAEHDTMLIIDEAHATGIFGRNGTGLASAFEGKDHVITVHTLGKALGCEGARFPLTFVGRWRGRA